MLDLTQNPVRHHVLTAVEFDVLWERLELGPTPAVLQIPSPGRTAAERREVVREGWLGLCGRGLVGPAGADHLLRLLARPGHRLELRGVGSHPAGAVACPGALAVRRDATVTLAECGSLPSAVHGVLPAARPGPGSTATAPSSTLAAALADHGRGLRSALLARGVPATDAGLLERMLTPGPGSAQVVAVATDAAGTARRSGGVLGVLDGPGGRYLMSRTAVRDAVEWTTVAPADARALRHRMAVMLDDVS